MPNCFRLDYLKANNRNLVYESFELLGNPEIFTQAGQNNINPGKCMIPNCLNIEWKSTKTSMFEVPSWEKRAIAAFHFERAFSKV